MCSGLFSATWRSKRAMRDKPGVILDYDKDGNIVGLEVLNASQRVENPRGVDYAVTS